MSKGWVLCLIMDSVVLGCFGLKKKTNEISKKKLLCCFLLFVCVF